MHGGGEELETVDEKDKKEDKRTIPREKKNVRHGGMDEAGWSCEPCEGEGREGRVSWLNLYNPTVIKAQE